MNTYIIWQDTSGAIQVGWRDDDSGWKGPKAYSAFAGADNGTSIACITPTAWPVSNLQERVDLARCYFQASGVLKEVLFDGASWALGSFSLI